MSSVFDFFSLLVCATICPYKIWGVRGPVREEVLTLDRTWFKCRVGTILATPAPFPYMEGVFFLCQRKPEKRRFLWASTRLASLAPSQGLITVPLSDQVGCLLRTSPWPCGGDTLWNGLEGVDELMHLKKRQEVAGGQEADNTFCQCQNKWGEILSIDEKLESANWRHICLLL